MQVGDKAGRLPVNAELVNIQRLIARYYEEIPDSSDPLQAVVFGTSGHRGSPLLRSYTRSHIAAIAQAIADRIPLVSSDRKFDWYRRNGLEFILNDR